MSTSVHSNSLTFTPVDHCISGPLPKTSEWEALRLYVPGRERPVVFGASEAAAACGLSKYDQPLSLYMQKRSEHVKEFSDEQRERMAFGLALEPVILGQYAARRECEVVTGQPMFLSTLWPFMGATPDAIAFDAKAPSNWWVVECKNTSTHMVDPTGEDASKFGVDGTDQVPIEYVMQAQQQMAVLGCDLVEFPVLVGGNSLRIYTVRRDEGLIDLIVKSERDLADQIVMGLPPDAIPDHGSSLDIFRRAQCESGKTIVLPTELESVWNDLEASRASKEQAKKLHDSATARLMQAVGDAEYAILGDKRLKRVSVRPTEFTVKRGGYSFLKLVK